MYDNLEKSNASANLTINTDGVYRKNKGIVEKDDALVKEAKHELEISEMRTVDDKIGLIHEGQTEENIKQEKNTEFVIEGVSESSIVSGDLSKKKNNENHMNDAKVQEKSEMLTASSNLQINSELESVDQTTEIIDKEAYIEPYKERVYIEQGTKVYPMEEVTLLSQDEQKVLDDLQNSNQEYQKDQEIPISPYFPLEKYENKVKQYEENYKEDSTFQANVKEVDSNGYIISDKLNFESAEINQNLRRAKQYSPEIKQVTQNAQLNKESDNEISKVYEIPHKLQIGHEKYIRPHESQLKSESSVTRRPPIKQAILENPIISNENVQFVNVNQGAKDIENPNLLDFHVVDTEKDLEVPDGVEGPIPAVALPPPSNRRGYIAVPFNGKQIYFGIDVFS